MDKENRKICGKVHICFQNCFLNTKTLNYTEWFKCICPIHYFKDKLKGNSMSKKNEVFMVEVFIFLTSLLILAFKSTKDFGNGLHTFDLRYPHIM